MDREPRALLFLLGLVVVGQGARMALARPRSPPGEILIQSASPADPRGQRARAERLARPLRSGERVDLNSAPAEEIARLPRIGMSLAKRIVEDRSIRGAFRGPKDLDRVPGVGPALLATLEDKVSYGGAELGFPLRDGNANPGTSGGYGSPPGAQPGAPVDLNSASLEDLVALPGIGPERAGAVLAYRRSHGSFAAVSDLGEVPGFSRRLVARLAPRLMVR
jgi:competence ComEA-like helix-hairpin-helix protein